MNDLWNKVDEWIRVADKVDITLFVNPETETAKVVYYEDEYLGYHDGFKTTKVEEHISIENALAWVYPYKEAISVILNNTKNDYSDVLKRLSEQQAQKT